MAASSVACSSSCSSAISPDEATALPLPLLSSCSLPPSHYLQTCPHLLTTAKEASLQAQLDCTSSCSLDEYRRRSLKSEAAAPEQKEVDLTCGSRSTSSPQLVGQKSRSKVYRRASLKSLSNISVTSSSPSGQSRIHKISNRKSDRKASESSLRDHSISGNQENKENVDCNPLSNPYPYSTPCQKNKKNQEQQQPAQQQDQEHKQAKSKSCSSFLPILSLIPHTMISFQYPSPKMKFSWWRNKIS